MTTTEIVFFTTLVIGLFVPIVLVVPALMMAAYGIWHIIETL